MATLGIGTQPVEGRWDIGLWDADPSALASGVWDGDSNLYLFVPKEGTLKRGASASIVRADGATLKRAASPTLVRDD